MLRATMYSTAGPGINSNTTAAMRVVMFASAMVVTQSTEQVITILRQRAAMIWKIDPEAVEWEDGHAKPAGANAGEFEPLSLSDIAAKASARTSGPETYGKSADVSTSAPARPAAISVNTVL